MSTTSDDEINSTSSGFESRPSTASSEESSTLPPNVPKNLIHVNIKESALLNIFREKFMKLAEKWKQSEEQARKATESSQNAKYWRILSHLQEQFREQLQVFLNTFGEEVPTDEERIACLCHYFEGEAKCRFDEFVKRLDGEKVWEGLSLKEAVKRSVQTRTPLPKIKFECQDVVVVNIEDEEKDEVSVPIGDVQDPASGIPNCFNVDESVVPIGEVRDTASGIKEVVEQHEWASRMGEVEYSASGIAECFDEDELALALAETKDTSSGIEESIAEDDLFVPIVEVEDTASGIEESIAEDDLFVPIVEVEDTASGSEEGIEETGLTKANVENNDRKEELTLPNAKNSFNESGIISDFSFDSDDIIILEEKKAECPTPVGGKRQLSLRSNDDDLVILDSGLTKEFKSPRMLRTNTVPSSASNIIKYDLKPCTVSIRRMKEHEKPEKVLPNLKKKSCRKALIKAPISSCSFSSNFSAVSFSSNSRAVSFSSNSSVVSLSSNSSVASLSSNSSAISFRSNSSDPSYHPPPYMRQKIEQVRRRRKQKRVPSVPCPYKLRTNPPKSKRYYNH